MSTKMTVVLKLLIAGIIIAYLVNSEYLSFSKILHALHPGNVLWMAMLCIGTMTITSIRWNILLRVFNFNYTVLETLKLSLIGTFFNTFMPGAVGGDLIKTYYIYAEEKEKKSKILASFSVLLDRIIGLLTLIFFVTLIFLFFWDDIATNEYYRKFFWFVLLCSSFAVLGMVIVWSLSKKEQLNLNLQKKGYFFKLMAQGIEIMSNFRGKWKYIFIAFMMTFVSQAISIYVFYCAAQALGFYDIPLKTFYVAVPLGMLVMALPLTPAGVGTGQAAFLLMFQWIGVPSTFSGADLCTLVQIIMVMTSLTSGFWFYIKYKRGAIKSGLHETPEPA